MTTPKASVQRYSVRYYTCEKDDDGKYVLHSDYAALEAKRAELVKALEMWQHTYKETDCEYDDCQSTYEMASAALARAGKEGA